MPADPKQVQAIFLAAVNEPDANERAKLLDRDCANNADLRRRVEMLLRAHNEPPDEEMQEERPRYEVSIGATTDHTMRQRSGAIVCMSSVPGRAVSVLRSGWERR